MADKMGLPQHEMSQEDEGFGQQDQHERVVIGGNLQWPGLVCGHSGERLHGGGGF